MRYKFTVVCDDDTVFPELLAIMINEELQAGGRDYIRVYHSAEAAEQGEADPAKQGLADQRIMMDQRRPNVNESKRMP